nr:AraC family transcriptional regulator [Neiella litorisoli]
MYFIVGGSGKISLDSGDVALKANHIYLIPSGCRHSHYCDNHIRIYWCHFQLDTHNDIDLFDLIEVPLELSVTQAPNTEHLLTTLCQLNQQTDSWINAERSAYALLALLPFLQRARNRRQQGKAEDYRAVLQFIREHLHQPIKLQTLADIVGQSSEHFSRRFKQQLGLSPVAYATHKRMQYAQLLLRQTNQQVKQIACQCGFDDPYHFSRVFKKHTGVAPLHYRSNYG